jgi:hypothetical protein
MALLSALLAVPSCLCDNYPFAVNRFLSELQDKLGLYWDPHEPAIPDDKLPPGIKPWKKPKQGPQPVSDRGPQTSRPAFPSRGPVDSH